MRPALRPLRGLFTAVLATSMLTLPAAQADNVTAELWRDELPIRRAWLRDRLPPDALAYHRIPHLLGLFATPKGSVMDPALRSEANVQALLDIQEGIAKNVLMHLPAFDDVRLRFVAERVRSPIEMAVFAEPVPSLLIAMNLNLESVADFQDLIDEFGVREPPVSLVAPLDAQGYGQLTGMPVPVSLRYMEASGWLLLQAGPAVTPEAFASLVATMRPGESHPMHRMERKIDESGHGWFAWADAARMLPVAQTFMPAADFARLQETGLDKVRAAAIGLGVADGKGRLSLVLDVAPDGKRQFLPFVTNLPTARSVGEPDAVVLLSVPTAQEFGRIESLVMDTMKDEDRAGWLDAKAEMQRRTGVSIEEILDALGPEIIGIFDAAGDYAAIRVRDKGLFEDLLERVTETTGSGPTSRRVRGKTFHHWSMPGDLATMDAESVAELGTAAIVLQRQRDHIYWMQDGDFIYTANLPQPLLDRLEMRARTDLDAWLRDTQRLDVSNSILAITGSSRKLPQRFYHIYVEVLQMLADISETDFDVWSMPTASELALPEKGSLGLSVNLGEPFVSIEMMFENNPLEGLFTGGATSVAVIGVLAAIAIPAYQDYAIRARVSEGLALAAPAQSAVTDHYLEQQQFPGPIAAAAINDALIGSEHVESVSVLPGSGVIVVRYTEAAVPDDGVLYLAPTPLPDGSIEWTCSSTIAAKHMPAACRDNPLPDVALSGA